MGRWLAARRRRVMVFGSASGAAPLAREAGGQTAKRCFCAGLRTGLSAEPVRAARATLPRRHCAGAARGGGPGVGSGPSHAKPRGRGSARHRSVLPAQMKGPHGWVGSQLCRPTSRRTHPPLDVRNADLESDMSVHPPRQVRFGDIGGGMSWKARPARWPWQRGGGGNHGGRQLPDELLDHVDHSHATVAFASPVGSVWLRATGVLNHGQPVRLVVLPRTGRSRAR
jgi:hypothetical protein